MSMTPITAATTEANATAFNLSGPCRLRADDLGENDQVDVYEQRVDLEYEQAVTFTGQEIRLVKGKHSIVFEGYGSYKCLISRAGIEVGYDIG